MALYEKLETLVEWNKVDAENKDIELIGEIESVKMFTVMKIIRSFEEALIKLDKKGLVHGPLHTSVGQEGAMVAAISLLRSTDLVNGSHRGHHLFLAKALNYVLAGIEDLRSSDFSKEVEDVIYKTMSEILGLSDGYSGGRGGSMHLRWEDAGVLGTNAIVGGGVPIALGAAWSTKRAAQGDVVLTAFGDGSCHIGNVLESFNLASLYELPICFFIENNGYAVSTTVEEQSKDARMSSRGQGFAIPSYKVDGNNPFSVRVAANEIVEKMRHGNGPAILEVDVYRYYHHSGGIKGSAFGYRSKNEEIEQIENDPILFVENTLINNQWITKGFVDELNSKIDTLINNSVNKIVTIKDGKSTIFEHLWPDPDTRDNDLRSDYSEFCDIKFTEQDRSNTKLEPKRFVDSISDTLVRRFETDERLFVIGEDVHKLKGGTNGATKGIPERWPDRCVATPIAEHAFVGLSGGVAMTGKYRPIVELMYPDFGLVAADQLFNQIAKARHMFGGTVSVPLVLRTKVAIGTGYGSQHSMDPAGLFSMWPGWRIVAPSTPFDYIGLMNSALKSEDPVLVIESVDLYNKKFDSPVDDLDYFIELGKAKTVRQGNKFTVLTYLNMVSVAKDVCDKLGIDAEIIDLRSLDRASIDWVTIEESIYKTNQVIVLEQGSLTNSYGAMLVDEVQHRYFDYLDHPVKRIYGGESSPNVSKVLERSAFVGFDEVEIAFKQAIIDRGE
ncbi:alpha-ketoacid dehydrogenase subunit alpha/beta [Vibrio crassostreae]|uniref:alpha-ketoacid dehydrogenase subunit alpha/beta n=1 Tax=Vibrio crassostreae TaxID=246167 RepID=UPI001B302899|nr:alpha-ketoacid dehydrogenase subunit alpha/beta [Vibrio crassostreae]